MYKLKTYWPEVLFFLLILIIGLISHWEKGNIELRNILCYIDQNGHQLIPRKFLDNVNLCFFFFWISTIFTYLFSKEIFKNRKWAFITVIIWYCTPILPGLAFFDIINISLVAFMMIGMYILLRFVKHPTYLMALILALVNCLAIFAHPIAFMIPVATLCFFVLNMFTRNLLAKDVWKVVIYTLTLVILFVMAKKVLNYSLFVFHGNFLPSLWHTTWYHKIYWLIKTIPPLWILYFLFALVALNVVYFSNYGEFLRSKWIYSFLFILLILFLTAPYIFPVNTLMVQQRYLFTVPSIIILGIAGCYEFSIWVRKRFGEKVYFVFKYSFLAIFFLQCLWSIMAMVWLHPHYFKYENWPLFFMN